MAVNHWGFDEVDRRINEKAFNLLYPNDPYSKEILGNKEDILSMSYNDLDLAFDSFYTPKNSILTIVGDIDIESLKLIIEEELNKFEFKESNIKPIPFIESKYPKEPQTIYEEIPYPEIHIMGRIDDINYFKPLVPNKIIALLDSLFSVEASFFKELQNKDLLLLDDIECSVSTHEYGTYYSLDAYTNDPLKLVNLIIDKLKNISIDDFNKEISLSTIKSYKSDCIRALDSISYIGDETLSLAIEGPGYEEEKRVLLSTKEEDIIEFIPYIKNSMITYLIALPKNVKNSK